MNVKPVDISHMIHNHIQTEDNDNNFCSICFTSTDENICTLNECQHSFHTNCILRWFRSGNSSCPCCRSVPLEPEFGPEKHGRYKFLRKYSNRKEAPKELKNLVEKLKKKEKYLQECNKNIREWKKTKEGKNWQRLNKIYKKLKNKTYSTRGTCGIWSLRSEIGAYPILPVYIPQKLSTN